MPGRYWRVSDDTPHYPGEHLLGSRTWYDSNWAHVQALGESIAAPHHWDTGLAPAALPLPILVGNRDCIAAGEMIDDAIKGEDADDGYPLPCFVGVDFDPLWHRIASIWHCGNQLFYARIIELLYNEQSGIAIIECRAFFGPTVAISYRFRTGSFPSFITIIADDWAAVICEGTATFQQIALQAFYSIALPEERGGYSTLRLWWDSATRILDALTADGLQPGFKLMLVGHSYGATSVLNVAARIRQAQPQVQIRYITFGCPQPGDVRMHGLLVTCEGINLQNEADLVTVLPPTLIALYPVLALHPVNELLNWTVWISPPSPVLQHVDGSLAINEHTLLDTFTLTTLTVAVLQGEPIPSIVQHPIVEYQRRISRRCPQPVFPATGIVGFGPPLSIGRGRVRWFDASKRAIGKVGLESPRAIAAGAVGCSPLLGGAVVYPKKAAGFGAVGMQSLEVALNGLGLSALPIALGRLGIGPAPFEMTVGGVDCGSATVLERGKWYIVNGGSFASESWFQWSVAAGETASLTAYTNTDPAIGDQVWLQFGIACVMIGTQANFPFGSWPWTPTNTPFLDCTEYVHFFRIDGGVDPAAQWLIFRLDLS